MKKTTMSRERELHIVCIREGVSEEGKEGVSSDMLAVF